MKLEQNTFGVLLFPLTVEINCFQYRISIQISLKGRHDNKSQIVALIHERCRPCHNKEAFLLPQFHHQLLRHKGLRSMTAGDPCPCGRFG